MLEFGHNISFVVLVIIAVILDLHLRGKLVSRPIKATSPKLPERLLSSITKSNIQM